MVITPQSPLKGEFTNLFLVGLSDVPKYDIIWTEKEILIYCFIPEILRFKECSNRVGNVLNTLNVNIYGMKVSNTSPFSVKIMPYLEASDRQLKKLRTLLLILGGFMINLDKKKAPGL